MRIAYLSNAFIPSRAANSVQIMKMCRAFVQNGHGVTLYTRAGDAAAGSDFAYYGVEKCFQVIKYKNFPRGRAGSFFTVYKMLRDLKTGPLPDLIYSRHIYSLAAAAHLGIPLVYESHRPPGNRAEKILAGWLFRHPDTARLVFISGALREEYCRIFPRLPRERTMVAHDGADPPGASKTPPAGKWPGREGCLQVGYAGHLYPGKGMEIISRLASRLPGIDFHVVGGTEIDIAQWKNSCPRSNIYFHGYVPPNTVQQYFFNFDIVLAPYQHKVTTSGDKRDLSRWMSPLKIFEYMAAGKAIICSDLPVLREILNHMHSAFLVPPGDIESWVNALHVLGNNEGLRKVLGDSARQEFLARYTWEKRAGLILQHVNTPV